MLIAALATLLAAAPTELKLAAPGLSVVNIAKEVGSFWTDHLAQQMTLQGPHVVTSSEIQTLLGMERQRELLGCTDASCTAELANALGVDAVVTGSIGKFGADYQINLKVITARDGRLIAVYSGSAGDEGAVVAELTRAAAAMTPKVLEAFGAVAPRAAGGSKRWLAVIPAVLGLGGVGLGVAELFSANGAVSMLRNASSEVHVGEAMTIYAQGRSAQTLGIVSLAVGAVFVVAAVALFVLLGASP